MLLGLLYLIIFSPIILWILVEIEWVIYCHKFDKKYGKYKEKYYNEDSNT